MLWPDIDVYAAAAASQDAGLNYVQAASPQPTSFPNIAVSLFHIYYVI